MVDTDSSDDVPPLSHWQRFLTPDSDAPSCMLWTGSYRKVGSGSRARQTPIMYWDKSRVCVRVTVAAHHKMCAFSDSVGIYMRCNNSRCVAPQHMRIIPRMARSLKRVRSIAFSTDHDEASISCSSSGYSLSFTQSEVSNSASSGSNPSTPSAPVAKRMRTDRSIATTADLSDASLSEQSMDVDKNTISFHLQQQEEEEEEEAAAVDGIVPWK